MTATTDVHLNTVTAATGAVIKPGPMVTAPPTEVIDDEQLADFAPGSGLNGPFVADLLAACITHERDGVNLFRMLAARSQNPMLQARYKQLTGEAEQATETWATLIRRLGGNEQYVSPPARLTETMDGKLIEAFQGADAADPMSQELAGVQAVLQAAMLCLANADAVAALAGEADGDAGRYMAEAATELTAVAEKHHAWAVQAMNVMINAQAKHSSVQKIGQVMERAMGKLKDTLH